MTSNNNIIPRRWKSTLVDTSITVIGFSDSKVPIVVKILAYELDYGPVIDVQITCNIPYKPGVWGDHPMRIVSDNLPCSEFSEIIDNTEVTRAIILDLANPEKKNLYTTTDCTYRAALIGSLKHFWS